MMDFKTAQTILKDTFDSAFSKKRGTARQRVAMANVCLRRVPCRDSVALTVWAVSYAENWTPETGEGA